MSNTRCTTGKDGKHYYFVKGRRVSAKTLAHKSRIKCMTAAERKVAALAPPPRPRSPSKPHRSKSPSKSRRSKSPSKPRSAGCVERSKLPLRPFQKKIVDFMNKNEEIMVCSGTGSGKTLTAVTISQCYLDKYPKGRVVVVMPAILVGNFQKELLAYGAIVDERYQFYSFERFITLEKRAPVPCNNNTLLIIDEAHNLRTSKSERFKAVMRCATFAHKKVLLTATPFVNSLQDLVSLIQIMYGNDKITKRLKDLNDDAAILRAILKLIDGKIAFMSAKQHDPEYPTSKEHYEVVKMPREYMKAYHAATNENIRDMLDQNKWYMIENPNSFMHGIRKAVNVLGDKYYSPKLERAVQLIKNKKSIIYTNWIEFGLKPIIKMLKQKGITYREFHGGVPKAERAKIIRDYNDDKFQVLIITKAGAEGIDLKGTRAIVILEPTWNDASLRQIIGRAIRFRSHAHLPTNQRHVDIYKMIASSGTEDKWRYDDLSGDALLYKIIERKQESERKILKALEAASMLK